MIKRLLSLLLCLLLLLSSPGMCFAAYQITDQELTGLDQIFNQLSSNNQQLLENLGKSKQDLTLARQQLAEYQKELETLQQQLQQLKAKSIQARTNLETAQASLKQANQLLAQYEREVKVEEARLKLQRDIGYLAVGLMAVYHFTHK